MPNEKLLKTYDKVRFLSLATPRARSQLIHSADRDLVNLHLRVLYERIEGTGASDTKTKVVTKQAQKKLRTLVKRKVSLRKKNEIKQKGGFLGAILPAVASVLGGLLGSSRRD
jgi:hypothetical protein